MKVTDFIVIAHMQNCFFLLPVENMTCCNTEFTNVGKLV